MYIKQEVEVTVEVLMSFSNGAVEVLATFIKGLNIVITIICRPPNTSDETSQEIMTKLHNLLEDPPNETTVLLILGDFNLLHVNWPSLCITGGTQEEGQAVQLTSVIEERFFTTIHNEAHKRKQYLGPHYQ